MSNADDVGAETEKEPNVMGMSGRFRKKPVEIEAMRLSFDNIVTVTGWCLSNIGYDPTGKADCILIETLEGTMRAELGDWIIRGVKGEFYPCKPDIFEATYERVPAGRRSEDG